jgi:hypothetical protein
VRLFEDRIKHSREIAGRGIDDAQHLSRRGLLVEGFVAFGLAFGKLALKIGNHLPGIGCRVVGHRARSRLSWVISSI